MADDPSQPQAPPPPASRIPWNKRLALINISAQFFSFVLNSTVLIWTYQYLIRRVPEEQYILVPLVMTVMGLVPLLTIAVTGGVGRYLTAAYAEHDDRRVTEIASSIMVVLAGVSLVLGLLFAAFIWQVDRILNIESEYVGRARWMFGLMMGSLVVSLPFFPLKHGLEIRQRFVTINILGTFNTVIRNVVLLILLLGVSADVLWLPVSSVPVNLVVLAVTCFLSHRMVPSLRFSLSHIRFSGLGPVIRFGGWTMAGQAATSLLRFYDPLMLNHFASAFELTVYQLGRVPFRFLGQFTTTGMAVLRPGMVGLSATGQTRKLQNVFHRGNRYVSWMTLWVTLPFFVFPQQIMSIYLGPDYVATAPVMVMFLGAFIMHGFKALLPAIYNAMGRPAVVVIPSIIAQIGNAALTAYFLVELEWGAWGAALATLITTFLVNFGVLYHIGARSLGGGYRQWWRRSIRPAVLPSLASGAVLLTCRWTLDPTSWWLLGLVVLAGMLTFAVTLVATSLEPEDRYLISKLLSRVSAFAGAQRFR